MQHDVPIHSTEEWEAFAEANREALLEMYPTLDDAMRVACSAGFVIGGGAQPEFYVHFVDAEESVTHTPLTVDECEDANGFATIRIADRTPNGSTAAEPIATVYSHYHAQQIVRSVNSHADLLAALERALPLLEKVAHPYNHEHRACEVIRAAIAKATQP